jgi:plasmid stability protein
MKNVTVTLDEDVARWARIWAARHETSVSRLLGELLQERMLQEEGYEAAMQQYLAAAPRALKTEGGYPSRDAIHERSGG